MTTSSKNCPQCGTPLPTDAPAGLCPRCVMAMNMATETQFTGEVGPHGTKVLKTAPTPEELAAKSLQRFIPHQHGFLDVQRWRVDVGIGFQIGWDKRRPTFVRVISAKRVFTSGVNSRSICQCRQSHRIRSCGPGLANKKAPKFSSALCGKQFVINPLPSQRW